VRPREATSEGVPFSRPAIWPAFLACAVAFVSAFGISTVLFLSVAAVRASGRLAAIPDEATHFALSMPGFIASNAANAAVLLGVAIGAAHIGGPSIAAALRFQPSRASGVGIASAVVGMIALSIACGAATDLLHTRGYGAMDLLAHSLTSPSPVRFLLALVTIAWAPAIAEESLFRGWLQTRLAARWTTRSAPAIVATAATFGAFHVDPVQGTAAFIAGLFLGWVSFRFGSIRPTILAHAANNTLFVTVAAFGSQHSLGPRVGWVALAGGIVVCLACIALLRSTFAVRSTGTILSERAHHPYT